jgi:hypothetical protein
MKQITLEQKETIFIGDIQTDLFFIVVKVNNKLLNYSTKNGLSYIVGGEPYEKEVTLSELIEGGAEAYQIFELSEATKWIKENL